MAKVPFFVHLVTSASEMTQFADIVLPATFNSAEGWSIVTNMGNGHAYASVQQGAVKRLWDVKQEENEVMWLLAEKLSAELRLLPPESWFGSIARELAFSTFYDWGHAKYAHDPLPTGLVNTTTLAGVGLGVIWERPTEFTLRLDLAWRTQGRPDVEPPNHQPRASFVFTKPF